MISDNRIERILKGGRVQGSFFIHGYLISFTSYCLYKFRNDPVEQYRIVQSSNF
ncbi:MAG: hypothetical protein QFX38_06605 [Methanothermobacter sp.]|nr:hypothetical protein [Methanothermobacter sp.]